MERLQTGQDRSSTSKVSRLNTVPPGQRYAMVMPSYFSSLSRVNAKKPSPYHHDMQGKTILAFSRIVHNSLLMQRRKELHRLIAMAIEELYAERLPESYEMLAYHYERGEVWEKALEYLVKAGQKAQQAYANQEALDH